LSVCPCLQNAQEAKVNVFESLHVFCFVTFGVELGRAKAA
jgi:hypothetical protein